MGEQNNYSRSLHSIQRCYVRFINLTERLVEITWVNYTGQYVRYHLLEKCSFVDINTFKTHPWMAKDVHTKDNMHIDKKFVYFPKTTREYLLERYPEKEIPENYETRIRVYITFPLLSLKQLSLLTIRDGVKTCDKVSELSLPKTLEDHVKKMINVRERELALFTERGNE